MATKTEKLQAIWHRFEKERGHAPTGTSEAVRWAVSKGLLDLPRIDPFEVVQLKIDVDAYNRMNRGERPEIQLVLDFTDDVAERELQLAA